MSCETTWYNCFGVSSSPVEQLEDIESDMIDLEKRLAELLGGDLASDGEVADECGV